MSLCSDVIRLELMCLTQSGLHLKHKINRKKVIYPSTIVFHHVRRKPLSHNGLGGGVFVNSSFWGRPQPGIFYVRWHITMMPLLFIVESDDTISCGGYFCVFGKAARYTFIHYMHLIKWWFYRCGATDKSNSHLQH